MNTEILAANLKPQQKFKYKSKQRSWRTVSKVFPLSNGNTLVVLDNCGQIVFVRDASVTIKL